MAGIATGLMGRARWQALKAHRLAMYQKAYLRYLEGEVSLDYLNERLNKLLEIGIKPKGVK